MTNDEIFNAISKKDDNVLINSYAGSGKTHLCSLLANTKPKILYLTFNKVMKEEFREKISNLDTDITCHTFHSLAYERLTKLGWNPSYWNNEGKSTKNFFPDFPYNYTSFPYKKEWFSLTKKCYITYCLNDEPLGLMLNSIIIPEVSLYLEEIVKAVNDKKLPCSFNFFLKKYSMLNETLNYDIVLIDEIQDLFPSGLNIILNQYNSKCIGVGDTYQNIYKELLGTVNLFDILDWQTYSNPNSYRVNSETAFINNKILKTLGSDIDLIGLNKIKSNTNATLFSSNFQILWKVYNERKKVTIMMDLNKINELVNFVEDLNKFNNRQKTDNFLFNRYLDENKTYQDLSNLYRAREEKDKVEILQFVRNKTVNNFREIINKYNVPGNHVYCTIHQSKGFTFNDVYVSMPNKLHLLFMNPVKFTTELNLLYVALTRASGKNINQELNEKILLYTNKNK